MTQYPTQYKDLSKADLYSKFARETWDKMSLNEKVELCQEIENRRAETDKTFARPVSSEPMYGRTIGLYNSANERITMNSNILEHGKLVIPCVNQYGFIMTDEKGNTLVKEIDVPASNWRSFKNVVHEGVHASQQDKGTNQTWRSYIIPQKCGSASGVGDTDLYRIQPCEKEANEIANKLTAAAMLESETVLRRRDPERDSVLDSCSNKDFERALENAKQRYNDPNIEQTLQQVVHDRENGIVNQNPGKSYQDICDLLDEQMIHQLGANNAENKSINQGRETESQNSQENSGGKGREARSFENGTDRGAAAVPAGAAAEESATASEHDDEVSAGSGQDNSAERAEDQDTGFENDGSEIDTDNTVETEISSDGSTSEEETGSSVGESFDDGSEIDTDNTYETEVFSDGSTSEEETGSSVGGSFDDGSEYSGSEIGTDNDLGPGADLDLGGEGFDPNDGGSTDDPGATSSSDVGADSGAGVDGGSDGGTDAGSGGDGSDE